MIFFKRRFSSSISNPMHTMPGGKGTNSSGERIKRFYKKVTVVEHPKQLDFPDRIISLDEKVGLHNLSSSNQFYSVQLDGRSVKTLYKDDLLIPSLPLAMAVAEEWES